MVEQRQKNVTKPELYERLMDRLGMALNGPRGSAARCVAAALNGTML